MSEFLINIDGQEIITIRIDKNTIMNIFTGEVYQHQKRKTVK